MISMDAAALQATSELDRRGVGVGGGGVVRGRSGGGVGITHHLDVRVLSQQTVIGHGL